MPTRKVTADTRNTRDARDVLIDLYWTGVRAAAPDGALRAALETVPPSERPRSVWIIALGKAAIPMASAAVEVLAHWNAIPKGGIIVAPSVHTAPHTSLEVVEGDHPIPDRRSHTASQRLDRIASRVAANDDVWVLLSGGATSLIAAPAGRATPHELAQLYERLLAAGLDIKAMNLIRKRFSRWGAGRLAVALAPARVHTYIVSDVIGDDLEAIGSGPCVPDPSTAAQIHAMLHDAGLWERIAPSLRDELVAAERDPSLETPKAGHDAFASVETRIVASNRVALEAIETRAAALGYRPILLDAAVAGEAAVVGRRLAATLRSYCRPAEPSPPDRTGRSCLIWGGETTVTLPPDASGSGGRCQELALSAARELAATSCAATLLAAGTDGRDGATDAAGAIVDHTTWDAIARAGRDPARDLAAHDSHPSLDAAGALLRTGLTGTNVMDVIVGIDRVEPLAASREPLVGRDEGE